MSDYCRGIVQANFKIIGSTDTNELGKYKVKAMWVKKFRLQKCWSQEQLAEMSGLSVRTVQRLEKGQPASMESLKALASVFELDVSQLQQEQTMTNHEVNEVHADATNQTTKPQSWITREEELAIEYVENLKGFYIHLIVFVVIMPCLVALNLWVSPQFHWFYFPLAGWLLGLLLHALFTFPILKVFSPEWEKRQVEKRLGRKL